MEDYERNENVDDNYYLEGSRRISRRCFSMTTGQSEVTSLVIFTMVKPQLGYNEKGKVYIPTYIGLCWLPTEFTP